jgi:hypothetical protein
MLKKIQLILFLLLASIFCFKEVISVKLLGYDCVFNSEDFGEDDSETNKGGDPNEEKQVDDFFIDNYHHQFVNTLLYCHFHKSYTEELLSKPYSEIQLLPPELV